MGVNENILNEWNKTISCFKKIKLKEAQELYKNNSLEIENTLYVVENFIRRSGFIYLHSSLYDMNDIISVCNQIWIEKINNGDLLKINSYSQMFDGEFYIKISNYLGLSKFEIAEFTFITSNVFITYFLDFVELKKNNPNITYNEYLEHLNSIGYLDNVMNKTDSISLFNRESIYDIFNALMSSFEDSEDFMNLSKTRLDKLKYILINNALIYLRSDINKVSVNNVEDGIISEIMNEKFLKIVLDSDRLNEQQKEVIIKRYGLLDESSKYYSQIALELGVTKERVRNVEVKAIRRLRLTKELKQFI